MKLQISFDTHDLSYALDIAQQVYPHADILELGTSLIYAHGTKAVEEFRAAFNRSILLVDAKIVDRAKDSVSLFAEAGADWITVMAGTSRHVIHAACTTAHALNKKIMLDLVDASSPIQSALEAKNLGADALLFHQSSDERDLTTLLDQWDLIKGNASVPLFISAKIQRPTIDQIIALDPAGIVIGSSIVEANQPSEEAAFYYSLCNKK